VIAKISPAQKIDGRRIDSHKTFINPDEELIELFDPEAMLVEDLSESRVRITNRFKSVEELESIGVTLLGKGSFELDFLFYGRFNVDLRSMSNGTLEALRLPTRLVLPFVFLILLSFVTPRGEEAQLDRYYVKMKTPVDPDPEKDAEEMRLSYEDPHRFDDKRLIKRWGLEFNKPNAVDIIGFIASFAICVGVVWLIVVIANYQP
jgi:hypothetical protein